MPNDHGTALTPAQQFNRQLDEQVQNFRALLPSHIPVEKFKRVVVVAISQNPDLFKADRRSLFTAAQKCAADGLLPDGRQAALVVYGNQAVYMPMVAGVRQRMRNSGEVLSAEAHVVYRNDKFFQKLGDGPAIVHEPPSFGTDRGEPVGAYAIIKLKNGEVLREVLDKKEIEKIRAVSKSKNGPAWTNWWGEMARKAALRRCAKAAPTSADIDELLARDDEPHDASMVDITPQEPEPPRGGAITHQSDPEPEQPLFLVIDADGEEREYATVAEATKALAAVLDDAARRGPSHWDAAHENNAALIAEIGEPQTNSPAGTTSTPSTTTKERTVAGDPPSPAVGTLRTDDATKPAGEVEIADLLGGKPRTAQAYRVALQDETSVGWAAWHAAIKAMIESGDPKDAILRDNKGNIAIFEQVDAMRHNKLMRELEGK